MQGICTHSPETNNVPAEYTVETNLLLLFMVPISLVSALALLCSYVSTFRSMCAVPNMVVFCRSLTSWFPGMLLTYFLNIIITFYTKAALVNFFFFFFFLLLLLLSSSLSSSSLSPLCRVFVHIVLKQTMSLGSTLLQLFYCYCLWFL
jgi:hypothetical protein